MPNWVFNTLAIEAEPQVISKIKEQVAAPYDQQYVDWQTNEIRIEKVEQPFSFWNIIKPENIEAYHDKPNVKQDISNPDHWYAWNNKNWGVKWDAKQSDLSEEDETSLIYRFDTPWGIAEEALLELSRQYPTAEMTLSFEEEQGWGGEMYFTNGMSVLEEEYENKCRQCEALNTMEYCEPCETNVCSECNYTDFTPEVMCETHKEKETVNG